MPTPTLSSGERAAIVEAAKLAASGATVRWRCFGLRLSWHSGQRERVVLREISRPVFKSLCDQVERFYADQEKHARKEAKGNEVIHGVNGSHGTAA